MARQSRSRPLVTVLFYLLLVGLASAQEAGFPRRCPVTCQDAPSSADWDYYPRIQDLDSCDQDIIFELNIYNDVDQPNPHAALRACTASSTATGQRQRPLSRLRRRLYHGTQNTDNRAHSAFGKRQNTTSGAIQSPKKTIQILEWDESPAGLSPGSVASAAGALASRINEASNGSPEHLFAKSGKNVVGVFVGAQFEKPTAAGLIRDFLDNAVLGKSELGRVAAQICGGERTPNPQTFGVVAGRAEDLGDIQRSLRQWNEAECMSAPRSREGWKKTLQIIPATDIDVGVNSDSTTTATSANAVSAAVCEAIQAQAGDGCWALADRCGITIDEFERFNPRPDGIDVCDPTFAGEHYCCTEGDLPDFSPQPNPDGTCKRYTVQPDDNCYKLGEAYNMVNEQIEERNKNTWGWMGCGYLVIGSRICLSKGDPPMPAAISNAICGPQKPGTPYPDDMNNLINLNPCPLKTCCNVWGQCGITEEFCTEAPSDTGAPGAVIPGSNGCISSCGIDIVNNNDPPARFMKVGYFEAWNLDRPCLHMLPRHIDSSLTHVHFAFAGITEDFEVDLLGLDDMFEEFKAIRIGKRILSFGGWSFSTDYDSFPIFREGVTPAQRQRFADNVVQFMLDHELDGVDFDWEYPGAPDIPGIPPGSPEDGPNYLEFLKLVREQLPEGKELGIAAPASFWYLRGFPIAEMSEVVDYIIYMTYDLHGQWDYGNEWAIEGCRAGDCLRSHVNQTEVEYSLSMVTKAGVPANKLIIGMALYGRSFQMAQAGCHGPDCRFTGPDSGARAGRCTETNGYISNYEIRQIIASSDNAQWISDDAGGDLLIYDDTQWVSWMSEENYNARVDWVRGLNFGGTSDWAVDLDGNYDIGEGPGDLRDTVFISPDLYEMEEPVVKCNSFPCTLVFPPWQLESPTTIRPEPTTLTFEEYWLTTQSHEPGESPVTTTAASLASTVITPSPLRLSSIDVWHAIVESDVEDGSLIWLTSSIILPEMTFTKTFPADPPDPSDPPGETTPPISRPPITWTYSPGVYPAKPYPTSDDPNDPDDPDDDPRPPTPPPDFPASVAFSEGPAEPTCLPGQACGGGCRKNCDSGSDSGGCAGPCGCIGLLDACPPGLGGCVGKGCGGGGGSSGGGSGGGGPGDDGPTTCSTRETASWCREQCRVEFYPESTTSTCQEDCTRTFSACSATDSTTTTTKTVTCPLTDDGNTDGFATMIYSGDFEYTMPSEPPTRPTSTTTSDNPDNPEPTGTPFPTLTPETGFHPLCFRDINDDNRYESFDLGISEEIVDNLCFSIADHLSPDVPIHAVVMADGLRAYIQWADDQTNCAPKADTPLGDFCKDTFWYLLETCDVFADGGVYGGGFVDNLDDGCTEWVIVNDSLAPRMLGNRLNSTVIELSVAN